MLESHKNNRIKFNKPGTQRNFILKTRNILGLTKGGLAKRLHISQRTLADWAREKITISQVAAETMSILSNIPIPKRHSIIDWRIRFQRAGEVGGKNKFLKYGSVSVNEKYRKEKWQEWWDRVGQYKKRPKNFQSLLKIKIPKKNKSLAEFVGIMLGDGGIAPYHVSISLSDQEMNYIAYIKKLSYQLFGVLPKVYKRKKAEAVDLVIQRKQLVDFCQHIGLVLGNKVRQQIDIPQWVKESEIFSRACIRGLVDTDGCFFQHNYIVKGQKYSYLKMAFTSASFPLVLSVARMLTKFGFRIRISKNKKDARIEDTQYVLKYIKEIGSHNSKHLQKIEKWKKSIDMLE
ncbi:MAG: LAGLIDADG family homing endonuclease [Patescibacteria group bacterium]